LIGMEVTGAEDDFTGEREGFGVEILGATV
jgi:hypothetical protein